MSDEQKESSVLFSLNELMNLEEDRVRQEALDKQRQVEAEVKAKEDAQRRAREEQEAMVRAEEERRRQEDLRRREDEARIEAMRVAEIERQRIEAERKAQLEAMSKQQEHARQLEMIRQDEGKKKLRNTLIGVGAFTFLAIAGGLSVYFVKIEPETRAREETARKLADEQREAAELARKEAEQAASEIKKLQGMLNDAKDDATKQKLQQMIDDANKAKVTRPGGGVRPQGGGNDQPSTTPKGASKGNCPPGDPLCAN